MTPAEIDALARKFGRLFERRPDPRRLCSTWRERLWIASAYTRGHIDLHPVRIPLIYSEAAAMTWNLDGSRSESAGHQLMKHAAWVWMVDSGAWDARLEAHGVYGGRPDVYSASSNWIVECGNTPIAKVRRAALDPHPPRFTLIPHQGAASYSVSNGMKTVGLFGVDITWSDDLRIQLEEAEAEEICTQPVIEFKRSRRMAATSRSEVQA